MGLIYRLTGKLPTNLREIAGYVDRRELEVKEIEVYNHGISDLEGYFEQIEAEFTIINPKNESELKKRIAGPSTFFRNEFWNGLDSYYWGDQETKYLFKFQDEIERIGKLNQWPNSRIVEKRYN